jgi:UDP-2,3-diacylglucosamine pyrophosphatase LpxH
MKLNLKDRIVGRPIRCNKQRLTVKNGKDYAEVLFIGDVHYGSPQCDKQRFLNMLDYANKNRLYIFLMGDLLEMATRASIGAGIYEQEQTGMSQFEWMCDRLLPLALKGLILGLHNGNHEDRVYQATGINVAKAMARQLSVPYLADACWSRFQIGKQSYSIYSLHGRTGARFDGTALLAIERISTSFNADLVAMGHCHKAVSSSVVIQRVENGSVKEYKKFLLITASYLKYDGGYAQTVGLPISKLGSPKVKFFADRHDLSVSW